MPFHFLQFTLCLYQFEKFIWKTVWICQKEKRKSNGNRRLFLNTPTLFSHCLSLNNKIAFLSKFQLKSWFFGGFFEKVKLDFSEYFFMFGSFYYWPLKVQFKLHINNNINCMYLIFFKLVFQEVFGHIKR